MIYHTKQFIINYRYDAFVLLSFVVLVLVVVKKKKKRKGLINSTRKQSNVIFEPRGVHNVILKL